MRLCSHVGAVRTGFADGVLGRAGVRQGQLFILGPDGSYDRELNRFFRELDGWVSGRGTGGGLRPGRDVVLPVLARVTGRELDLGVTGRTCVPTRWFGADAGSGPGDGGDSEPVDASTRRPPPSAPRGPNPSAARCPCSTCVQPARTPAGQPCICPGSSSPAIRVKTALDVPAVLPPLQKIVLND
jgi:hypothetical protein